MSALGVYDVGPAAHHGLTSPAGIALSWLLDQPVFLDTETTGLDDAAEVVEIAVIDYTGELLLDTLVKPSRPIPLQASLIHGITDANVATAPTFAAVVAKVREVLQDRRVIIYNADYDVRVLRQSAAMAGIAFRSDAVAACAMRLYARYWGERARHGGYRWHKLDAAAAQSGLEIPPNLHRAAADAELCRRLVTFMANT